MRIATITFRLFFTLILLAKCTIVDAGITIDSVRTTQSTCANNGTVRVYAHNGSNTIFYAITGGPATRPQQTNVLFGSLTPGTYQILITDLLNDTARTTATVTGNYTPPTFSPTYTNPACPGAATGIIIGHAGNTGTRPFTWQLTNTGTSAITTQSSDTFRNLTPGTYSLRELDSCGNYSTYSITLVAPTDSFNVISITNDVLACDSVKLGIGLFVLNSNYATPYTIQVRTHNGTYQHTINNMIYAGVNPYFSETVTGVTYGDSINFTITDACGRSVSRQNTVADFYVKINFNAVPDSCRLDYIGYFYLPGDSTQSNVNITYFPDPVTVVVSNPTTNAVIGTYVTNDTLLHSSRYVYTGILQGNQNYNIKITDGCGNVHSQVYSWPVTPGPIKTSYPIAQTCLDSTACMFFQWQNTFFSTPTFQLLSGPSVIGSTKPFYVYHDSILYPQSFLCYGNTNGYNMQLSSLAPGTYHYRVYDSCGNSLIDSFTVRPADLNIDHFSFTYKKGCPGQNVIALSRDNFCSAQIYNSSLNLVNLPNPVDTLINLNFGTYIATFTYRNTSFAIPVNHTLACQVVRDTINIPAYIAPRVIYSTAIKCSGTMYVTFIADSTAGVPPYKYQILSGPQTSGVQASNTFTLTQPGSYTTRVTDSCGFAGTYTFTVDTLAFSQIINLGASCAGFNTYLNCQHSPYATYVWQRPNGTFYTGDSLPIIPITSADFGIYHVKKIVNVNGCRDTFYTTYNFAGNAVTQTYSSICPGQTVLFAGIVRSVAGTYYDTLHTSTCDSIVALHLSIRGPVYDSVSQSICPGNSVTVGVHTYYTAGVYRDTFVTPAGCDSIHILQLQILPYKRGSVSTMICPGHTLLFGGHTLSSAGIYYDTVSTTGCDSIITLTLTIRGPLYDSVSQTICAGQSASAGTHTYFASGIYRDTILTGGCDSVHVLNLHVTPLGHSAISTTICRGQGLLFGGINRTQSGTYYDTLATAGCDSIVTLTLNVRGPLYDSLSLTICAGQSASAGIHTYTATGIYRDTIATAGCDSIHVLNLHVTPYGRGAASALICPGQSYLFGGHMLTSSGLYYDTVSTAGCDSIIALTLAVRGPLYDSVAQSICIGHTITVGTHVYSATGLYRDTINAGSCDSIHVLNLTVLPYKRASVSAAICPTQILPFGSQSLSAAGVYYDTIPTAGCDSIVTLTLTIKGPVFDSVSQNICPGQSVRVGNNTYTTTGIYRDTFVTQGCDSIHILNLHLGTNARDTFSAVICPGHSYLFGGIARSLAGTYNDTIPTAACDSIVTLNLSVRGPLYDSVSQTICAGQSVTINTHTYNATGIYHDTIAAGSCDSIHVLDLHVTPYVQRTINATVCPGQSITTGTHIYNVSGIYSDTIPAIVGCDSVITTRLTVLSAQQQVTNVTGICVSIFNGQTYTADTTLRDTIVSVLGCDSVYIITNIQVVPPAVTVVDLNACIYPGQSYVIDGHAQTTAGIYSDTVRTVAGACDSVITNTHLRVISTTTVKQHTDSCFRATINNITYTSDAIIRDTIHSVCGLDSVIVIDTLHIFDPSITISSSLPLPIIDGETTQLTISPSGNYQNIIWSPNYDISNIYAVAPLVDPARDTTYYVTAEDSNHCQVSAQIYIPVAGTDLPEFIMPTAFSPNGDGKNDIYRPVIKTNGTLEILAFQIYDRWGELVFDKNVTGTAGWDGTYKNVKQPIAVYVYFINVKTSAGQTISQSGNLTLLR